MQCVCAVVRVSGDACSVCAQLLGYLVMHAVCVQLFCLYHYVEISKGGGGATSFQ